MAGCGGGGGGKPLPQPPGVTITGKVDDGMANSPIPNARCRFVDGNSIRGTTGISNQNGEFSIVVPPNVEGQINCHPENLKYLKIYTYSSTMGMTDGQTINGENVSPITTIVTRKVWAENRPDKKEHKEGLLGSIETLPDSDLALVARLSSRLYKAMLEKNVNVDYGGEGIGGNGDGGVGGDAGDGGDFSPIPNARCEFVVSNDLKNASVLYSAALDDFKDDGIINRPDLKAAVEKIYPVFQDHTPEEIKAAFEQVFPSAIGKECFDVTDENGVYFIERVPANVPGFVRCFPPNQEKLTLATYVPDVPERQNGIPFEGQDVNPATTVFSTNIAAKLDQDLGATKQNYLDDISGLTVQIIKKGGVVSDFYLIRENLSENADKDVSLVAFSATSLFNIFYKNGVNVDYLAALDDFTTEGKVDPAFLEKTLGVPSAQANEFSDVVDDSVLATGEALDTNIKSALSSARINVTVTDMPGGDVIEGATVDIINDLECEGCGTQTNSAGLVTLTLRDVPAEATEITVEASGFGFAPVTATTEIAAFATVNLEVPLTVKFPLSVQIGGNGTGTVTGSAGGIDCLYDDAVESGTCEADLNSGTLLTLTAIPSDGSTFSGWSGDCSGIGPCLITMDRARNVTATFTKDCSYSISPTNKAFTYSGGTGSITVTPSTNECKTLWNASASASWITITSGSSGSGQGTVNYTVAAYTGTSSRSANITVAGKTHMVTQDPPIPAPPPPPSCIYSISPTSNEFPASGGEGSITVNPSLSGCKTPWEASTSATWIKIISGRSGSGQGTVSYMVSINDRKTTRTATITVDGNTHKITQFPLLVPPTLISPKNGAYVNRNDDISFDWNDVPGATIYRFIIKDSQGEIVKIDDVTSSSYKLTSSDISPYKPGNWIWAVYAGNKYENDWNTGRLRSIIWDLFVVEPFDLDPPRLIRPSNGISLGYEDEEDEDCSGQQFTWNFDWSDVAGATKYKIVLDPGPVIIVEDSSEYETLALDLLYGADSRIIRWRVQAGDDYGRWSSQSELWAFTLVKYCRK
jgi:hypothetical protein